MIIIPLSRAAPASGPLWTSAPAYGGYMYSYVGGRPGDVTPGPRGHPDLRSTKESVRFRRRGFFSPYRTPFASVRSYLNNDNTASSYDILKIAWHNGYTMER
jgi:hypothetical protein